MATQTTMPSVIEARAIARHVRMSPQKARLVIDLIRGQRAQDAIQTLRFTRKRAAHDIEKVLRSAIANAQHMADEAGESLDVDELYVSKAFVNEGLRWKRIRPAPFGRAFRYQKRTAHIEIHVIEHHRAAAGRAEAAEEEARKSKGVAGAVRKARKALAGKKPARTK
jgi:large subunit ribosomal protein L22